MRFRRVGARAFLRLDDPRFEQLPIFGDCGAFTYHQDEVPPYTPEDMAEFYADGGFTHGCSVDHIIFDFDESLTGMDGGTNEARRRFDITLENARAFLPASRQISNSFTPLGVIQGWSPGSMAAAAGRLVAMGYDYLALGGTVPLKAAKIKRACEPSGSDPCRNLPAHPRLREGRRDSRVSGLRHHQLRHGIADDPRLQGRQGQLLPQGIQWPHSVLHRRSASLRPTRTRSSGNWSSGAPSGRRICVRSRARRLPPCGLTTGERPLSRRPSRQSWTMPSRPYSASLLSIRTGEARGSGRTISAHA